MKPLERLGQDVRTELDRRAARTEEDDLERAREGFLTRTAPARTARRAPLLAVAATLAAAAAFAVVVQRSTAPIGYRVVSSPTPGEAGRWLDGEVALTFSEGSTMLVAPRSRARVDVLRADGATVTLERGHAAVSVAPRRNTDWSFVAGPFDVKVTGTRFDLDWDAREEVFSIAMQDGSVLVRGPTLGAGATVIAGQTLRVALHGGETAPAGSAVATAPSTTASVASPPGSGALVTPPPSSAAATPDPSSRRPPAGDDGVSWRELAQRGEYARAVQAADAEGTAGLLASANAADLLLLADAARFAGRTGLARDAYLAVRSRFPGSPSAALAAFALGRLGGGDALAWFQRYLAEAPGGSLAREALGRVMELEHGSGRAPAARDTARRYLASFPEGPHAPLARALLAADADAGASAAPPPSPSPPSPSSPSSPSSHP